MSTALNHQKRSHRSHRQHLSAVGSMSRRRFISQATKKPFNQRFNLLSYFKALRKLFNQPEHKGEGGGGG